MMRSEAITRKGAGADSNDERRLRKPVRKPRSAASSLRSGDESVLKAFFLYFHPLLLDQARLMGVDSDTREEVVLTFLDDKVIELALMELPPPSLTGYVIRGFRNRVRNLIRDKRTRLRVYDEAALEVGDAAQLLVAECHSEYGASAADTTLDEPPGASPAIARLAQYAKQRLSDEEIQLLVEASRRGPLREVPEWHHMSYAACRVRIHRLRNRTSELAREYLRTLNLPEKTEIERFLRRCGALED
jgi:hypothetical protein